MSPEMIKAIGESIASIAWPLIVLYVIVTQKKAMSTILSNLESLTLPGGIEAKLRKRVEKEAEAVLESKVGSDGEVTERQILAAQSVEKVYQYSDISIIRRQMLDISSEYERVRASMTPGKERTRRMEVVTTKMRTLGLAAYPLLSEFITSESPGCRLAAISILQVKPNSEYLDWLGERLKVEQPFVGYHAAVALEAASRVLDKSNRDLFLSVIAKAKSYLGENKTNTDRWLALDLAERQMLSD